MRRQLEALSPAFLDAVEQTISDLAIEPDVIGKPLLGRLAGVWAARVGNYRLLYTIGGSEGGRRPVVVRSLQHRAAPYGRRRRRP